MKPDIDGTEIEHDWYEAENKFNSYKISKHVGDLHERNVHKRPFNWEECKKFNDMYFIDKGFKDPRKYVVIGADLTKDILFGNLNGMATVWITGHAGKDDIIYQN